MPAGDIQRYHYDQNSQRSWMRVYSGAKAGSRYWFGERPKLLVPASRTTGKKRFLQVGDSGGTVARIERIDGGTRKLELFYSDALQNLMLATSTTGNGDRDRWDQRG